MTHGDPDWERRRAELVQRPQRQAGGRPSVPKPGKATRFDPLNALVDGGWLGALTPRELRVWLALYRMANGRNLVRASHGTIAARAKMLRADAARTTSRLERRGIVRVLQRGRTIGQAGKRTANEYEVLVPDPSRNSGGSATNDEDE
jgi:hypothetical protein